MPRVDVWIRKEDWDKWQAIEDVPEFIHNALVPLNSVQGTVERVKKITSKPHEPDAYLLSPKLAKENPDLVETFDKLAEKIKDKNMKFCKEGHPIPEGRTKCMGKGCKYS